MSETINGSLSVSNDVIADIAGYAAMTCYGVVGMAELLQGAEQMTGQRGKPRNGALQVVSALDSYARYFADPDFRPLAH